MGAQQATATTKHRTVKGAQRIQKLINAAVDLFLERGYEAVAVGDLIVLVGGSRSNIYSHFGGKEGLFIEAMKRVCAEQSQPLEQLHIGDCDAQEALSSFGRQLLHAVLQPRTLELHRLMVAEGRRFPELSQAVLHAGHFKAADTLTPWVETLQSKHPQGLGTHLRARTLAEQFVNMVVMEAQLRALTGLDPQPLRAEQIDRIVDNAVSTFLNGALPRKAPYEFG